MRRSLGLALLLSLVSSPACDVFLEDYLARWSQDDSVAALEFSADGELLFVEPSSFEFASGILYSTQDWSVRARLTPGYGAVMDPVTRTAYIQQDIDLLRIRRCTWEEILDEACADSLRLSFPMEFGYLSELSPDGEHLVLVDRSSPELGGRPLLADSSDGRIECEFPPMAGGAGVLLEVLPGADRVALANRISPPFEEPPRYSIDLWEVSSCRFSSRLFTERRLPIDLQVSPDGATLAVLFNEDAQLVLLDLASGTPQGTRHLQPDGYAAGGLSWSADGSHLAILMGGSTVAILRAQSLETVQRIEIAGAPVSALAFSPDGSRLAVATSPAPPRDKILVYPLDLPPGGRDGEPP